MRFPASTSHTCCPHRRTATGPAAIWPPCERRSDRAPRSRPRTRKPAASSTCSCSVRFSGRPSHRNACRGPRRSSGACSAPRCLIWTRPRSAGAVCDPSSWIRHWRLSNARSRARDCAGLPRLAAAKPVTVWPASSPCTPAAQASPFSPSYPSGHATVGAMNAILLARMIPERRAALFARGWAYGDARVISGVHFPSDVEAGRILGTVLVGLLDQDPRFRADQDASRHELREALGLHWRATVPWRAPQLDPAPRRRMHPAPAPVAPRSAPRGSTRSACSRGYRRRTASRATGS